jgi:flagellar protein FliO/FliZ
MNAIDFASYLRFLLALVFVLGLILAAAWAARRFGLGAVAPRIKGAKRLAILEVAPLDAKRRLVLVRRDGAEHLLLIGGESDLVVERAILPDLANSEGNAA